MEDFTIDAEGMWEGSLYRSPQPLTTGPRRPKYEDLKGNYIYVNYNSWEMGIGGFNERRFALVG
jgi:hypothetical protein